MCSGGKCDFDHGLVLWDFYSQQSLEFIQNKKIHLVFSQSSALYFESRPNLLLL